MTQPARLITPEGESIDLSPDTYAQVTQLLASQTRRLSRATLDEAIRATYGKYAGEPSLSVALRAERAAERIREEDRAARFRGQ